MNDQAKAERHESLVRDLFEKSGYEVSREPPISGKRPDLLVTGAGIPDCVVECKVVERQAGHEAIGHSCVVSMDSDSAFGRLYSKVHEKIAAYRNVLEGRAYVVAVCDEDCVLNYGIASVAYGGWVQQLELEADTGKVTGRGWRNVWDDKAVPGLLRHEEYRHCSGILYSAVLDSTVLHHTFLPNARPAVPVLPSMFSFARIAELKLTPAGISIARQPTSQVMPTPPSE